jgi:hypothetical protein
MLNCKKLLSMALACAMATTLAVPAFAATTTTSENTTNRTTKVTAAYQAVTVDVVVPTTGTVIINPYALPVEIATGVKVSKQQVVAKPMAIKNKSDTPLKMNVTVSTLATGNLKLVDGTSWDDAAKENNAAITMSVLPTTLAGAEVSEADIADLYKTTYGDAGADTGWTSGTGVKTLLLASTDAKTATVDSDTFKACTTLTAATFADGKFSAYASGSIAVIGFSGKCVQDPTTAWATKDGVTVTLAFSFNPGDATA